MQVLKKSGVDSIVRDIEGQLDTVSFLILECGGDINVKDKKGRTALHLAAKNELDIVKFLVEYGVDIICTSLNLVESLDYLDQVVFRTIPAAVAS